MRCERGSVSSRSSRAFSSGRAGVDGSISTAWISRAGTTTGSLVPLSDTLVRATGDWQMVFAIAVAANAVAAVLAIAVLRPMRAAWLRRE